MPWKEFTGNMEASPGCTALQIPRSHLEAIANDIVKTGQDDPQWKKYKNIMLRLEDKWEEHDLVIHAVAREKLHWYISFMLKSEWDKMPADADTHLFGGRGLQESCRA